MTGLPRRENANLSTRNPRQEYSRLYHRIYLCLDPFPCNGGTTTMNAFWMGVQIVALVGTTVVGRAGWSLLCNLDLQWSWRRRHRSSRRLWLELAAELPCLTELRAYLREPHVGVATR